MAHLHTIFKVETPNAESAVQFVNGWLEPRCGDYYNWVFDWYDPDNTEVLPDFTEEDYQRRREKELAMYRELFDEALSLPDSQAWEKGILLFRAAQLLWPDGEGCQDRLVFDLTDWCDDGEPTRTYYVRTDRHY